MIMEKPQGVTILLLAWLSLLPFAMGLQTEGRGVTDERVKLADKENLGKVRILAMSTSEHRSMVYFKNQD